MEKSGPSNESSGQDAQVENLCHQKRCRPLWKLGLRLLQWACLIIVLLALVMVLTPAGDWWGKALTHVDPLERSSAGLPVRTDYIVVLGGEVERSVEAAELFRRGYAPKVIFTNLPEGAEHDAHVAEMYGLPDDAVIIDPRPARTADHPRTIAEIPGIDPKTTRFIIVTSLYHTSRSKAVFDKAGYAHAIMRAPGWRIYEQRQGQGWTARSRDLFYKLYETLAWGMYKIRGWV